MNCQTLKKKSWILLSLLLFMIIIMPITFKEETNQFRNSDLKNLPNLKANTPFMPISSFRTSLPVLDIYENTPLLNSVSEKIVQPENLYDRPSSIYSTFFAYTTLEVLDPTSYGEYKDGLEQYIMSKFNVKSHHFEETLNYSMYHEDGAYLFKTPYSYNITHQMAIILLANIGRLSTNFNPLQILAWENEILAGLNSDGGFGSIFAPHSTLLETYYAIWSVKALNNYEITAFSPIERNLIQEYVESTQRTGYMAGAFNEYDTSAYLGWENYYASWEALKIIEMIDGDFNSVRDPFINFLVNNNIYNSQSKCYYGEFNDYLSPETVTYFGSAIIADCIRLLEMEMVFPELSTVLGVLLNSTTYNRTDQKEGPNYFYFRSSSFFSDDLFIQSTIIPILDNFSLLPQLDDSNNNLKGLQDFCLTYFNSDGGASYITKLDQCAFGDKVKFSYLKHFPEQFEEQEVLNSSLSRLTTDGYFSDYINYSITNQSPSQKILSLWGQWSHFPIATNYFILDTINDLNLIEAMYEEIGFTQYLKCEQWIADQLLSTGYFLNDTHLETQTGNIKSTFYALEAQNILIKFDRGQSFANYYSIANLTTILGNLNQSMVETDTLWHGISGSNENAGITQIAMTYYILRINEILATNQVDYTKLSNFLYEQVENFDGFSYEDKAIFIQLCNDLNIKFDLSFFQMIHPEIGILCAHLIANVPIYNMELIYLGEILQNDQICVAIEIPPDQIIDSSYTYSIQSFSLASEISISEIELRGEETTFNDWNIMGRKYSCEIVPEANQSHPQEWQPDLSFSYKNIRYGCQLSVLLNFSWIYSFEIIEGDQFNTIKYCIQSQPSIISKITPNFEIRDIDGLLVAKYTESNVSADYFEDRVEFTCLLNTVIEFDQEFFFIPIFQEDWAPFQNYYFMINSSISTTTTTTTTDVSSTTTSNSTTTNTSTTTSTTSNSTTTNTSTTTATTSNSTTSDTSTTNSSSNSSTSTSSSSTATETQNNLNEDLSSDENSNSSAVSNNNSDLDQTNFVNPIIYFSSFVLIGGVSVFVKKKSGMK
ncbi:hypothetical protein NEF87_004789 [Candidatus Lokiarchaeum ossiferum]|uniref:Uncharacterized protein n=1 Tax=Candidatus Lokiarchaeum ossiferum TaxID=2951803 RepID=A0ABY6HY96_9ARCH|nr:hypothetical protein NEF87_004789 [Candidatus Lokiarchaeum sp. B-35]